MKMPWDIFIYKEKPHKNKFELFETAEDDSNIGNNTPEPEKET